MFSKLKNQLAKAHHTRLLITIILLLALPLALYVTDQLANLRSRAAGVSTQTGSAVEGEDGQVVSPATVGSDAAASGGKFVLFGSAAGPTTPPPPTSPPSGIMPTTSNTGPTTLPTQTMTADEFLATRTCNNKIITDNVRIETNGLAEYAGATFSATNCIFSQGFAWLEASQTYGLSQYPTINFSNTEIRGTFLTFVSFKGTWDRVKATNGWNLVPSSSCGASICGPTREIPLTVSNSYFSTPPIPFSSDCYHSEAFHAWGNGSNYKFTNTRFVQLGEGSDPYQFCHTGSIYQEGGGGVIYDGCYFDDGSHTQQNTYFFTINIDGAGTYGSQNIVRNSYIERGGTYATNPRSEQGTFPATYTNNFDFNTRQPITIP